MTGKVDFFTQVKIEFSSQTIIFFTDMKTIKIYLFCSQVILYHVKYLFSFSLQRKKSSLRLEQLKHEIKKNLIDFNDCILNVHIE